MQSPVARLSLLGNAPLSAQQIAETFHNSAQTPVIVLMVGVPASGKSALVQSFERLGWTRLSKDQIRFELYGDEAARLDESLVEQLFVARLKLAMQSDENIVVDTTNVFTAHRQAVWRLVRERYQNRFLIHFALPLKLCLKRNALRSRVVNPAVIRMFHDGLYHKGEYPRPSEGEILRLRPHRLGQYRVLSSIV